MWLKKVSSLQVTRDLDWIMDYARLDLDAARSLLIVEINIYSYTMYVRYSYYSTTRYMLSEFPC